MIAELVACQIDEAIKPALPPNTKYWGLTSLVQRTEGDNVQIFPAVYIGGGDSEYTGIDDDYDAVVYHRSISSTTTDATTGGYGRKDKDLKHTIRMVLVLFAKRDKVQHKETLGLYLSALVRGRVTNRPTGIKWISISTGDIVLNEEQVFREEYRNIPYFLTSEHIYLKLNYTIESTLAKECFNNCEQTA